jgi:hypothetical protein
MYKRSWLDIPTLNKISDLPKQTLDASQITASEIVCSGYRISGIRSITCPHCNWIFYMNKEGKISE